MDNSSYVAPSRQMTLERQMAVVAGNIANMNTPGYKAEHMLFETVLERAGQPGRVAFVQDVGLIRDLGAGALETTGNPLDLALEGEGYFTLEGPAGNRYSRAGSFHLNPDREIVHTSGAPLLAEGGGRLLVPQEARDIRIDADGLVTASGIGAEAERIEIGQIQIAGFADDQAMTQVAGGLFITDQEPQRPEETAVLQGYLEASNVNAIVEMTRMMEISRSYASTQRMLETEHERMRSSIQTLGTLNA